VCGGILAIEACPQERRGKRSQDWKRAALGKKIKSYLSKFDVEKPGNLDRDDTAVFSPSKLELWNDTDSPAI